MSSAPAKGHGADDFAIVVGVAATPGSARAVERAHALYDWLVAPDGGGLPRVQAGMIVSGSNGDWSTLTSMSEGADKPIRSSVREWFDGLELPRVRRGGAYAGRAGRRLYVYFSGPAVEMPPREYVMLAPGPNRTAPVPSIWIHGFVTSVCDSGLFEEVVAFADLSVDSIETERRGVLEDLARRKLDKSTMAPSRLLLGFSVRGAEPQQAHPKLRPTVEPGPPPKSGLTPKWEPPTPPPATKNPGTTKPGLTPEAGPPTKSGLPPKPPLAPEWPPATRGGNERAVPPPFTEAARTPELDRSRNAATFTDRVLQGLQGAARLPDGRVTARSLIRFVTTPDNLSDVIPRERPWFEVREPDSITLVDAPTVDPVSPNVWLLSPADSDRARDFKIELAKGDQPHFVESHAELDVGDVVFVQRSDASALVGMARVREAQKGGPPAGVIILKRQGSVRRNRFRLTDETPLQHAVERQQQGDPVARLLTRAETTTIRLEPADALAFCGAVIAQNPDVLDKLEQWLGESQLAASAYAVALSGAQPVDVTMMPTSLVRRITREQFASILIRARTVDDPSRRRRVLRQFATSVRQAVPGRAGVLTALRDDDDPDVQSLATPPRPRRETTIFTYACFFDSAALNDTRLAGTITTLASRVADGLRVVRGEPMWFFMGGPHDPDWLQRAFKALPESACVVLPYTERLTKDHTWLSVVTRIVELEDTRAKAARDVTLADLPSFLIPLVIDSPASASASATLMDRQAIDATALLRSPTDDTWADIVERIVEEIVHRCRELDSLASARLLRPRPSISRRQALRRIELVHGDLLDFNADAIVNPVGVDPRVTGQLGLEIAKRLGRDLMPNNDFDRELTTGETIVTPTFGRIRPRFVIHTCTDASPSVKTAATIAAGAVGALDAADRIPDVRTVALPSLGTGAAQGPASEIAPVLLPEVVKRLERGSRINQVVFVFRDESAFEAYRTVLDALREEDAPRATPDTVTAPGRPVFLAVALSLPGPFVVGNSIPVTLKLLTEEAPNATRLVCPLSALELTTYIEAPGFHIDGPSAFTVSLIDGKPDRNSITISLVAVAEGRHEVTLSVHARGGGATPGAASSTAATTTVVNVDPAVELPNVPELIDRRTVPNPQPDVMLYIALERTPTGEQLRAHVTCHALGFDRRRLEHPIRLTRADVRAIRHAASQAASGGDGAAPHDVNRAMHAFGGALFDLLAPKGHELRDLIWHLVSVGAKTNGLSWLVISDDDAVLPWDLICPHGYDAEGVHHYGECLAHHFAFSYWIGRKGFTLAEEAPIGVLGLVHYGHKNEQLSSFHAALGGDALVGIAEPELSLEIMRPDSPFFGVHLLRYNDASEQGRIAAADDTRTNWRKGTAEPLVRDRKLDFTLRRPIVALSLVDDALDTHGNASERDTQLEPAWSLPLLMARVSAVVGPRWTTSPTADRVFYCAFYDAIRGGVALGQAVFDARGVVRRAYPDRADWLAYSYFGHPHCAPYEVQPADGFTLFEPLGMGDDEAFEVGRTYRFRASYRSELPAWFGGRRRVRRQPLVGEGVSVMVAPLLGGPPTKLDLVPVLSGAVAGDDYHQVVELTMPKDPTELPVLVQFTRNARELQSTIVRLDVRRPSRP